MLSLSGRKLVKDVFTRNLSGRKPGFQARLSFVRASKVRIIGKEAPVAKTVWCIAELNRCTISSKQCDSATLSINTMLLHNPHCHTLTLGVPLPSEQYGKKAGI